MAKFADMLAEGGKSNSLGRSGEVVRLTLADKSRVDELYNCLFLDDAWARMRAADALEKVCREQPEWLEPYIDKFSKQLASSTQPSIQWHFAQIYGEVSLTESQRRYAISWLSNLLSSPQVDWIVAANSMETLASFHKKGWISEKAFSSLLNNQLGHKSKAVVKRATKLLAELNQS